MQNPKQIASTHDTDQRVLLIHNWNEFLFFFNHQRDHRLEISIRRSDRKATYHQIFDAVFSHSMVNGFFHNLTGDQSYRFFARQNRKSVQIIKGQFLFNRFNGIVRISSDSWCMHDIFNAAQRLDKAFQFTEQLFLHLSQCKILNGGRRRTSMTASPENLSHLRDINFGDTATRNQINSFV